MEIRRLGEADAATAASELAGIYSNRPIDPSGLRRALRNDNFVLLVARADNTAAGYLHAVLLDRVDGGRMLLVYDVEVAEGHRRLGIGTALMTEARRIAKASRAGETWLVTEPDNEEAAALYESLAGTHFPAVGYEWSEQ